MHLASSSTITVLLPPPTLPMLQVDKPGKYRLQHLLSALKAPNALPVTLFQETNSSDICLFESHAF